MVTSGNIQKTLQLSRADQNLSQNKKDLYITPKQERGNTNMASMTAPGRLEDLDMSLATEPRNVKSKLNAWYC